MEQLTVANANRALMSFAGRLDADEPIDEETLPDDLAMDAETVGRLLFALEAGGFLRRQGSQLSLTYAGIVKVEQLEREG